MQTQARLLDTTLSFEAVQSEAWTKIRGIEHVGLRDKCTRYGL